MKLDTPTALTRFMSGLIHDTISGQLDPTVSKAVVYAVSVQQRLIELSDLEKRLEALEQVAGQQAPRRNGGYR
jgi:hypothetical protein